MTSFDLSAVVVLAAILIALIQALLGLLQRRSGIPEDAKDVGRMIVETEREYEKGRKELWP